jgi:hypothetical protein
MSREPRPILATDTARRLTAIIRRLGGTPRSAESLHYLPTPPRHEIPGQPDMFVELGDGETPG